MRARTRWFSKVVAIFLAPLLLAQCGGPGDAVQLAFTSTPQLVTSGRPFSVVVQARDRSGQGTGASRRGQSPVVISLSLGAGPPAAALGGGSTRPATTLSAS